MLSQKSFIKLEKVHFPFLRKMDNLLTKSFCGHFGDFGGAKMLTFFVFLQNSNIMNPPFLPFRPNAKNKPRKGKSVLKLLATHPTSS